MKKLALLFIAVFIGTVMVKAQPGGGMMNPEERAKSQTERIKEAVSLNADQEKKVYELNLESGKKMQEMFSQNQGGGMEGMREQMQASREEQNKKLKEILSADQWTKYEKYLEENPRGMGGGGPR